MNRVRPEPPLRQLERILEQWQSWSPALSHRPVPVSPLGSGLTNKSYLLHSNLGRLVLRMNNPNGPDLGINREREALILAALQRLEQPDIGPEIIYQDHRHGRPGRGSPGQGYLVYRFIDGRAWTKTDIGRQQNQQRLKKLIARYQKIQLPLAPKNYKDYLYHYWRQLEERGLIDRELQRQWSEFIPTLDCPGWVACLSHQDLTAGNIIETANGSLRIIDWEYAHLGHPEIDWAAISGEYCSPASDLLHWMNRLWTLLVDGRL